EEVNEPGKDLHLSTADDLDVGFHPWLNIESARWLKIESAPTHYPLGTETLSMQDLLKFWDVHGQAAVGPLLMRRLESATRTPLDASTMRRYQHLFSSRHLVQSKSPVYCPECCADHESPTYGRLLWEVQCVTACPDHRVLLRSARRCGAAASERLPVNSRPAMRSVCGDCGSIGFACIAEPPEPAPESLVWVAQQVGRLLALSDFEVSTLTRETSLAGLRDVVDRAFNGSVVNASLESGLARATVHSWLRGGSKPCLSMLVQLCLRARADLLELLRGRFHSTAAAGVEGFGPLESLAPRPYARPVMSRQQMAQRMEDALASDEVVSVRKLCNGMGISPRAARERFPEFVRSLARRSRVKGALDDERRFQEAAEAYSRAAEELRAEGKVAGAKYIQKRAGLVAFSHNHARVRALSHVLAKVAVAEARDRGSPPQGAAVSASDGHV
ncbi:MAG: TniQ family protein, partial [Burkholderiales bacterium]|nr:TniQ family protein [Burkholderiales bacterium]